LPAVLGTAASAAVLLTAAPALASEGPVAPPSSAAPLPSSLVLPNFAPIPSGGGSSARRRPVVTSARLSSRRVRSGKSTRLKLKLSTSGRVRIVLERTVKGRRTRVGKLTVAAKRSALSVKLPGRVHRGALRAGTYRVTVTAIDSTGLHSKSVRRSLTVRRRAG
jgi:hypothetical protein